MAWTQADIDALKGAIGSGARVVKFSSPSGSREIQYSSVDEMIKALALMEAEVNGAPASFSRVEVARGFRRRRSEWRR